ncbi:hypothetical protein EON65_00020 [archaeon]|nr:MAG: hypothetical protein EON65_00020 [archaeon]
MLICIYVQSRATGSKINHMVLSFSYSTFTLGSTTMQEMFVKFIVNGVSADAQRYVAVNSLKPADWNANAVLHTFPDGQPSGAESALYKLYIYDKVSTMYFFLVIFTSSIKMPLFT